MDQNNENPFYILSNNTTTFMIFRDLKFNQSDIIITPKSKKEFLTLVFDLEDLTKELDNAENSYKFEDIINNNVKNIDNKHINIVIKNSLVGKSNSLYSTDDLKLNELFVSDELYRMSPYIDTLFKRFKPKKLVLKKFKINSKSQLNFFLEFILDNGCEECEELELDDIFIELLVKENENDEAFNELEAYISFENGKFYIQNKDDKKEIKKLKKLKMTDCPLFALSADTFKNINNYKDISIDIDENSLLNPDMITKFKIYDGYSDIYFDLDIYKLSDEENEKKDQLDLLDYLFNIIIDNEDNINFKKLSFRNFDLTKYEYITGENLTFIKEQNWILNNDEKKRKERFEKFNDEINKKINEHLNKLPNLKELSFDNCSNYFMNLIFKFVNHNFTENSNNYDLDSLKIKKCGKEHFYLQNIMSLKIKNLKLFDTPLTNENLSKLNKLGNFENLTIKLCSLEHYCKVNNLDYYKTLEIIVDDLITNEALYTNLILEMNALPIIMTFLVARQYNKIFKCNNNTIPKYFQFLPCFDESDEQAKKFDKIKEGIQKRDKLVNESFKLNGINDKKIIIKKNNIKNKIENFEFFYYFAIRFERANYLKCDFGKDIFNLDVDFRAFFLLNKLDNITLENCLFSNYSNSKLNPEQISETIINLIRDTNKNYKLDIKSLNEVIYKNKSAEDITFILKYLMLEENQQINAEIIDYIRYLGFFFNNLKYLFERFNKYIKNLTIIFNNIKERKQFYCLLCVLRIISDETNNINMTFYYHDKPMGFKLPNQERIKEKIGNYFIKKKNENDKDVISTTFNNYYTSDEEMKLFGSFENRKEEIRFERYKFKIEYKFRDQWDFIMK